MANNNVAIQSNGTVAWNGTTAFAKDITKYTRFAWVFEVIAPLAADTIFKVQSAPPSAPDPCIPGVFTDVMVTPICAGNAVAAVGQIVIPAGTPVGSECSGTIPCYPNKFIRLAAVSGDNADVLAVLVRTGPQGA